MSIFGTNFLSHLATNVLQIAEGGEYEALNLIKPQMLNRSTTVDISTKPPLLAMCCYTLFFFTN
jgi:hypothetical protein